MPRIIQNFDKLYCATFPRLAALAILLTGCFLTPSLAQQPGQKTFSSPEDASSALVAATQGNDEKAMLDILGPDGKQVVSSGDDAEDAQSRANFAEKYGEMHRLVKEPDGTTVLYIGARNWPTPIPLMEKGGSWYFDTEAGKQEVLYRRIGRNELSAIRVCQELVAAQKEFRSTHGDQYASKILSGPGQQNGLYWKAADGEPQSPIGPLVAACRGQHEGSRKRSDSLPRLLLPYCDPPGKKWPRRLEELHGQRQIDRGIRVCGLSSGIQVIGCEDVHGWPGWSRVREGSWPED